MHGFTVGGGAPLNSWDLEALVAVAVRCRCPSLEGLVEQHACVLPCALFMSPVRVLGRNAGIGLRPELGIPQRQSLAHRALSGTPCAFLLVVRYRSKLPDPPGRFDVKNKVSRSLAR
jgi:hypothetical protein